MVESLAVILSRVKLLDRNDSEFVPFPGSVRQCSHCHLLLPGNREEYMQAEEIASYREISVDKTLCECATKAKAELDSRVSTANLPAMSFDTWEHRQGAEAAHSNAQDYAASRPALGEHPEPAILMLVGSWGTGKSHLLSAIGHARLQGGDTVAYAQATDLLDRLRATYDHREGHETTSEVLDLYHGVKVLLLDDLGAEKDTEWSRGVLTSLVDDRYRHRRLLVVTTNLKNQQEMARQVGERIADRLFDTETGIVRQVRLTCDSYRTS